MQDVELLPLHRLVTESELAAAQLARERAPHEWLDCGRRAVGLPLDECQGRKVPRGFAPFPAVVAQAEVPIDPAAARLHGRVWWKAYKLAKSLSRSNAEIEKFKQAAKEWFAAGSNAETARISRTADETGLSALCENVTLRSRRDVGQTSLQGAYLHD